MRRIKAICRKELQAYFYSPVAYVAFAFYFVITGLLFSLDFLNSQIVDVRPVFGSLMFIYLFIIPLLTMRLVSDELNRGTDELLLTSPASITEIIVGKYLAAFFVQLAIVVCSMVYPLVLSGFGKLDLPVMWLSYLSLLLLGSAMMAVGLFASTLSAHQMVAGIAAFAMLIVFWLLEWLGQSVLSSAKDYLGLFSISGRVINLQKGVFDISDVLFYITFIVVFVVLSIQVLERKRWK